MFSTHQKLFTHLLLLRLLCQILQAIVGHQSKTLSTPALTPIGGGNPPFIQTLEPICALQTYQEYRAPALQFQDRLSQADCWPCSGTHQRRTLGCRSGQCLHSREYLHVCNKGTKTSVSVKLLNHVLCPFSFHEEKTKQKQKQKNKNRPTGEIDSANEGGVFDDLSVVIHNHLEVRQQSMHCKCFYWINQSNFFCRARNHIIIRNWGPAIHRLCSIAAHHQIQDLHWILNLIVCLDVDIWHSSTLSYAKLS